MFTELMASGSGGGGNNPTLVETGVIARGQTKSVTIDTSKDYIISGSANTTYSSNLMDVYACIKGTVTHIADGASAFDCTQSGNALTLYNGAGSAVLMSYVVVQLD